jgi:hypothetical protein
MEVFILRSADESLKFHFLNLIKGIVAGQSAIVLRMIVLLVVLSTQGCVPSETTLLNHATSSPVSL